MQLADEVGMVNTKSSVALFALFADGPTRPGQLADVLSLMSGGLTYLVDQLEVDRLVERSYGLLPEDRRAVVIRLTEQAEEVGRTIVSIFDAHSVQLRDALSRAYDPPHPG